MEKILYATVTSLFSIPAFKTKRFGFAKIALKQIAEKKCLEKKKSDGKHKRKEKNETPTKTKAIICYLLPTILFFETLEKKKILSSS